ncbi:hypothetical protein BX600DRAFT_505536 [Xylariales sp. PMI_506]|nr:hypothetical protein BX600DRAFT_505536 [Xylariales sp. PMI_506]
MQQQENNNTPSGEYVDDSYVSRSGNKSEPVSVVSDRERVDDPIDAETANSDRQLASDERDAIDESNIIDERTRGASAPEGAYREPGDDEGLPGDDGTSSN